MILRSMLLAAALAAPLFAPAKPASAQTGTFAGATFQHVQMVWDDDEEDYYDRRRRWRERQYQGRAARFDCNEHRCIDLSTGDLWYSTCDRRGCRPLGFARRAGQW